MILLDSNLLIEASRPQHRLIGRWLDEIEFAISEITIVETLGFPRIDPVELRDLEAYIALMSVLPVNRPIIDCAVLRRQQRRMSLGDALIAATALVYELPLATRNTRDFRHVDGLILADVPTDDEA